MWEATVQLFSFLFPHSPQCLSCVWLLLTVTVHFLLWIDEQSLFGCHVQVKPTTYIIAYKSPPMTIWQFQFINVKYVQITWTTKVLKGQLGNTDFGDWCCVLLRFCIPCLHILTKGYKNNLPMLTVVSIILWIHFGLPSEGTIQGGQGLVFMICIEKDAYLLGTVLGCCVESTSAQGIDILL